eukprot:455505-Rhodomonas_salina.1
MGRRRRRRRRETLREEMPHTSLSLSLPLVAAYQCEDRPGGQLTRQHFQCAPNQWRTADRLHAPDQHQAVHITRRGRGNTRREEVEGSIGVVVSEGAAIQEHCQLQKDGGAEKSEHHDKNCLLGERRGKGVVAHLCVDVHDVIPRMDGSKLHGIGVEVLLDRRFADASACRDRASRKDESFSARKVIQQKIILGEDENEDKHQHNRNAKTKIFKLGFWFQGGHGKESSVLKN